MDTPVSDNLRRQEHRRLARTTRSRTRSSSTYSSYSRRSRSRRSSCTVNCTGDDDSADCFSGDDTVSLYNGIQKPFHELKLGERIQTAGLDGKVRFSEVIFLPHGKNSKVANFNSIEMESGKRIKATNHHLLVTCHKKMVRAADVTAGTCLLSIDGEDIVSSVTRVTGNGLYTAVTQDELIIVGGIIASPFAVSHTIGHFYYNLHRTVHTYWPFLLKKQFVIEANEQLGVLVKCIIENFKLV
uniref:Hint domain-containing protein n=1 Tax=Octactis speculum TaxID=3111310 RepID=A0A7S2AVF6_9STRA